MAIDNINIPSTQLSFYTPAQEGLLKSKLGEVRKTLSPVIEKMSKMSNIPAEVLTSFIFIESGGKPNLVSSGKAVGLMQIKPEAASDVVILEKRRGKLTPDETSILVKKLGKDRTNAILNTKNLGDAKSQVIKQADMLDPELNLLIGTMYLGLLMDEHNEAGKIRMDKVITRYNRGYFIENRGKKLEGLDVDTVLNSQPKETKAYILKMLGNNGTLTTMIGKNK